MERLRLRRLSGKAFERDLAEYTEALRAEIEATVAGFAPDAGASRARVERARGDFRFFAGTYFPHYRTISGEAAVHTWIFDRLPGQIDRERGTKTALAAPRGEAKSTLVSLQFALWCLLTGRKRFPLLISDTADQAKTLLAAVKAELEANARLHLDYPEAVGMGRMWRNDTIVTRDGRMVRALGSGQRIRGLRHGAARPDLVIGDDLENDEQVRQFEQRRKTRQWWGRAVLYVGPPDGSLDVIVVGTKLHYDSLLASLLASPAYLSATFRAIETFPDRMDLWDAFADLATAEGETAAREFYLRRQPEMDAGAMVSWPEAHPLELLMLERALEPDDFATEKQNDPSAGPDAIFTGSIHCWTDRPTRIVTFGAVDPSLGRTGAGRDPSAILVGGLDRTTRQARVLYVLEAAIRRRKPDRIIADVIALQRQWKCQIWAVEAVQFQEYFRQELVRQSALMGMPVPAQPVTPHTDKGLRIESLQPHMKNRLILLHRSQSTLIDQLKFFPNADHDDGPDALEMLFTLAMKHARRSVEGIRSFPRPDVPRIPWEQY